MALPDGYRNTYLDMMRVVAGEQRGRGDTITAFWPLSGHDYRRRHGIMVVGRAVNGWGRRWWRPEQMLPSGKRVELVDELVSDYEQCSDCPMSWVTKQAGARDEYNTNTSAFWRIAHRTNDSLLGESDTWTSRFCWSNLYKLSPSEGGNPPKWLRQSQLSHCIKLLKMEVTFWKPRLVLVVAGADWFEPFVEGLHLASASRCELVEQTGENLGVRWIVGKHPQCKPEGQYMDEIKRCLANGVARA